MFQKTGIFTKITEYCNSQMSEQTTDNTSTKLRKLISASMSKSTETESTETKSKETESTETKSKETESTEKLLIDSVDVQHWKV